MYKHMSTKVSRKQKSSKLMYIINFKKWESSELQIAFNPTCTKVTGFRIKGYRVLYEWSRGLIEIKEKLLLGFHVFEFECK